MKTRSLKNHFGKLLFGLILVMSMGWSNIAKSCPITANFTYTLGVNGNVSFTSTSSGVGPNSYYFWDADDGSGMVWGNTTFNHLYLVNGTYNVLLYIQDTVGACFDSIRIPITVSNITYPCTLRANFKDSTENNGKVKFTSTSTGTYPITLYYWNFGDGTPTVLGGDTITHQYMYDNWYGNPYKPKLTIKDTGSALCADSIIGANVFINNADSSVCSAIHPSFTSTIDTNGHAHFTSTSLNVQPTDVFYWNPGDGSGIVYTGWNNTFSHIYLTNGTFNVTMRIEDDTVSCRDSIIIPVTVSNVYPGAPCNLVASFITQRDSNGAVKFTSTSTGTHPFTYYTWNPGDGSPAISGYGMDTINHTYPFLGTYHPTLAIRDTGVTWCNANTYASVYTLVIYNRDSLHASFTYVSDSIPVGEYTFTSNSQGTDANTYYRWTPGDGDPADSGLGMTTYTHTYAVNGPYSANLTIWYTVLPHRRVGMMHYSESSYTLVINVNTVTGIATVSGDKGQFNLYPNPSNGQFRIALSNMPVQSRNVQVEISNILGETVYKTNYAASNNQLTKDISMQNTPAGLYFVRILTGDKVYTAKMVIGK
jgi:PKD repeat protein